MDPITEQYFEIVGNPWFVMDRQSMNFKKHVPDKEATKSGLPKPEATIPQPPEDA